MFFDFLPILLILLVITSFGAFITWLTVYKPTFFIEELCTKGNLYQYRCEYSKKCQNFQRYNIGEHNCKSEENKTLKNCKYLRKLYYQRQFSRIMYASFFLTIVLCVGVQLGITELPSKHHKEIIDKEQLYSISTGISSSTNDTVEDHSNYFVISSLGAYRYYYKDDEGNYHQGHVPAEQTQIHFLEKEDQTPYITEYAEYDILSFKFQDQIKTYDDWPQNKHIYYVLSLPKGSILEATEYN
ncbi:MAG: hypothetical protein Q4F60_02805 [Candidatus Saccharibacteria bacterium]|nr:hypothetical protein [Candidatus Saccharibacteria bacterium]